MNKYIAFLLSALMTFSSTSYAYEEEYEYDRSHVRSHVRWVCNPYTNICYKIYRERGFYSQNERYWTRKYYRKRRAKNTEPRFLYVRPPEKIDSNNIINVNLAHGTWGAYDSEGNLIRSGRVSGGKSYCPDIKKKCKTATGTFTIYDKKGSGCKSKIFPVGKGGAPMPYCMFFHEGFALHGSYAVPNYNASHGCVRMSPTDAKWLNQNFVKVGTTRVEVTYEKMEEGEKKLSENE